MSFPYLRKVQGPNDPKNPIAVVVHIEIKPELRDKFLKAIAIDAKGSRTEDGCYRFDVLRNE